MWVLFALASAFLLGFYDFFKKISLKGGAVIPVLWANTVICSLFFIPLIICSACGAISSDSAAFVPSGGWAQHRFVMLKAVIVLSSWICGYFAIKHLPLTIVGPVNSTRPVMALVGALLVFGEKLNPWQWAGVAVAITAFVMLGRSGRKEGIDFSHNRWIWLLIAAAVFGAASGLYDKYLMSPEGQGLDRLFVQGWYNVYQAIIMGIIFFVVWLPKYRRDMRMYNGAVAVAGEDCGVEKPEAFRWKWTIPMISVFLTGADLFYLTALSKPGAMIAVVSMVRRSSVLVSFAAGAAFLHEKNLRSKAVDLVLVFISLILLLIGSL